MSQNRLDAIVSARTSLPADAHGTCRNIHIIMRHNEPYVDDIILTSTPIKNIQDPMERYGLK